MCDLLVCTDISLKRGGFQRDPDRDLDRVYFSDYVHDQDHEDCCTSLKGENLLRIQVLGQFTIFSLALTPAVKLEHERGYKYGIRETVSLQTLNGVVSGRSVIRWFSKLSRS